MLDQKSFLVPNDTTWFDESQDVYFAKANFKNLEFVANVNLKDLISPSLQKIESAQNALTSQSQLLNEIRNEHEGYAMPFLYYTHDFRFAKPIPKKNYELEKIVLSSNLGDSLRRRHIALSHVILPKQISETGSCFNRPITIKNFGSGVGLDVLNAIRHSHENVGKILNYDINEEALEIGRKVATYLADQEEIPQDKVFYQNKSLLDFEKNGKSQLSIIAGVICGLTDKAASTILKRIYRDLEEGGKLVITCANQFMRDKDALANFIIQHIGTYNDPTNNWGLNFRTKDQLFALLDGAGFVNIEIYDDANYPAKETVGDDVINGVETLPAKAHGYEPVAFPIALPKKEILEKSIGFNWIGIARK